MTDAETVRVDRPPVPADRQAAVVRALADEAELLDEGDLDAWLATLTPDVTYRVAVRVTRERAAKDRGLASGSFHFDEDLESLRLRVLRLSTQFAWAEDPPSRTRHYVTNIRVDPGETDDDVLVRSYVLLHRTRGDDPHGDTVTGERHDRLRLVAGRWCLASRLVLVDQAVLGTRNLAVLL